MYVKFMRKNTDSYISKFLLSAGLVQLFGESIYIFCRDLNEKMDTTLMCVEH